MLGVTLGNKTYVDLHLEVIIQSKIYFNLLLNKNICKSLRVALASKPREKFTHNSCENLVIFIP